ncbi:MAG: pilus assembly protein PilM [Phycisphaerales bacterium]|nr:pilus assembly protein PilM [Phycisphaerales bacterium]
MSTLHPRPRTHIGVDIGAARIKVAQLARGQAGWRLVAAASIDRAAHGPIPTEAEVQRVADVIYGAGFCGASVVVGAPRGQLHSAVLELPPRSSGAPIEQICEAETARMFRLSPGSYEMYAWEMPTCSERSTATQMTVSALEAAHAEELVRPFQDAGLTVDAIDLAGEALARACATQCVHDGELTALVDVGWSGVDLVVYRAGEPVYERWLAGRGLARVAESISRALAVEAGAAQLLLRRVGLRRVGTDQADPVALARLTSLTREYAEQLLNQVLGSVVYVLDRFHGEAVTRVRLTGGGAAVPDLAGYMTELSSLDVRSIGPRACGLVCGADQDRPDLMVAIGHALWSHA